MSLIAALVVRKNHIFSWNLLYFFWKTLYTKLEKYSIPNCKRSRKKGEKGKLKRSRKQLSNKRYFSAVLQISCSKFRLKLSKGLELRMFSHKSNFKRSELEARTCFQRQSFIKYLRQNLVFMWRRKSFSYGKS